MDGLHIIVHRVKEVNMSLMVGLTGGIATGKSTVSTFFKEAKVPVIDTDVIAKNLLNKDTGTYAKVLDHFGEAILNTDKTIHRKNLAKLIFEDENARTFMNQTLHPEVKKYMISEMNQLKQEGHAIIVCDVPLLFESGFDHVCDVTLLVYIPKSLQIERLMIRDQISKSYALKKIESQMSMKEKRQKADLIIDNTKSILETKKRFNEILNQLKERLNGTV
jgi:dephospho-CoA kinase